VSDELLTSTQAGKLLGISGRTINDYARRGLLVPTMVTPGGHRRWLLEDLRQQLRALAERQRDG